jgi:maltose-binding protein MalE
MRAAIAPLLVVAACTGGGDGSATSSSTTLPPIVSITTTTATTMVVDPLVPDQPVVVWVTSAELGDAIETRAVDYTAATGVAVEVEVFDPSAVEEGDPPLPASLFVGVLEDSLPRRADIVIGPHTWVLRLAEAGMLEPMIALEPGLPEKAVDAVSLRGFALGVPLTVDSVVQVRNPDLMASAPASVEDLGCPASGACLVLPGNGDPDILYPFLVALGGYTYPADEFDGYDRSDLGMDSDPAIAGAAILQQLAASGRVTTAADSAAVAERFVAGDAALAWISTAELATVEAADFESIVEPIPEIRGNAPIAAVRVTAAFVNPHSETKSAASEFAAQWLGDVDGSARIASALEETPVWREAATEAMGVILDAVETGDPAPYVANFAVLWSELARAFSRILGGVTPSTALAQAAASVRAAG